MNKAALFFLFLSCMAHAQSPAPAMADGFRESGKIYVVIGVIAVVFVAVAFFLVYLERKVSRLEKQQKH